jgi:16S rRNA (cytosine1402-N4)-methyltransferase
VLISQLTPVASHQPVLLLEVLAALNIHSNGIYVDCTFGRGGHSQAILKQLGNHGQVLAFDQDPEAMLAAQTLSKFDNRFTGVNTRFTQLKQHIIARNWLGQIQGVLLDLGVSSPQLEVPTRGFSFMHDGPLDMRMDPRVGDGIGVWLSQATIQEVARVLKEYGEERYAWRIAKAIVAARQQTKLTSTVQLANIIAAAHPHWEKSKHPATRSFQALRIFINRELEELQQILPQALEVLAPKGRLVVISFHSLEDRIVKRFIRNQAKGDTFPINIPLTATALRPQLRIVGKPIFPSDQETLANPRARSAVLRVAEKHSG